MLAQETSTSACFLPVSLQFSSFKTLKGWRPPSSQSVCVWNDGRKRRQLWPTKG